MELPFRLEVVKLTRNVRVSGDHEVGYVKMQLTDDQYNRMLFPLVRVTNHVDLNTSGTSIFSVGLADGQIAGMDSKGVVASVKVTGSIDVNIEITAVLKT